jgi:hypothetical protein
MEVVTFSDLRIGNSRTCLVIRPWTLTHNETALRQLERGSNNLQLRQYFNKIWKTSGVITDSDRQGNPVTLLRVGLPHRYSTRTHSCCNENFYSFISVPNVIK